MWVDAHCHMSFYNDRHLEQALAAGRSDGFSTWCLAGYDSQDWLRQESIYKTHSNHFYLGYGLHPWCVVNMSEESCREEMLILTEKASGAHFLGECGLDYFIRGGKEVRQKQIYFLKEQLKLAQQLNKPLIAHVVQAHQDFKQNLMGFKHKFKGLIHGYTGSKEGADEYVALGFKISVGVGLLHPAFKKIKSTVAHLDLKHLLIESDFPNSRGVPGTYNSEILLKVASEVAQIKGLTPEEVLSICSENFHEISK